MKKENSVTAPPNMVNLWDRLELKLSKGNSTATFITRIEDIDREALIVEKPIRIAGNLNIEVGQSLEVVFNREDASYTFQAVVAAIDPSREDITTIQAISDVKRSQRRRFVRIDIAGSITFRRIDTSDVDQAEIGLEHKGELLNVSAGGVLLSTKSELKQNDFILLKFRLKNSQELDNILGLVKRLEKGEGRDFLAGIEFLAKEKVSQLLPGDFTEYIPTQVNFFDEALQKAIVQFVYRQQVESRKKSKVGQ
jgi:c-di-GMP-binding flagellar brake protein YcgR